MKRELMVFAVIGGLLWAATGISVLAVTFFDDGVRSSRVGQAMAVEGADPHRDRTWDRSRDEETGAPLCEIAASDQSPDGLRQDRDHRSGEAGVVDGDTDCCWSRKVVSLLRLCLFVA